MTDTHSPAEAALSPAEPAVPPSATRSDESVASAGDLSMTPNAIRMRERRNARPHLCRTCGGPVPPEFHVCDDCTHPEHARRRVAGRKRDRSAQGLAEAAERAAELASLSPYSQRIEDAIADLEKHAQRALKLARDADAGVRPLRTKRPRAIAVAGAQTGTPGESR